MAAFQDPLHPTEEERQAAAERLRAIRNNRTGHATGNTHGRSRRTLGNLTTNLEAIQQRIEEIQRKNHERRLFEERRREVERAAFTGECFECRDRGPCIHCERGRVIVREMEAQRKASAIAELLDDLTPRMQAFSLESYPRKQIPAYRMLVNWLSTWNEQQGLMLVGSYGTGKTGLLVGTLKHIAGMWYDTTHRITVMTGPDLMQFLRSGYDGEKKDTFADRLQRVKQVRLLAIDDIGAERPTDWAQEQLFAIVNHRYEHMLPTFVTTNYGADQLATRLGERVLERMIESSRIIEVSGDNLRRKGR